MMHGDVFALLVMLRKRSTENRRKREEENCPTFERLITVTAYCLSWLGGYFKDCISSYSQNLP